MICGYVLWAAPQSGKIPARPAQTEWPGQQRYRE